MAESEGTDAGLSTPGAGLGTSDDAPTPFEGTALVADVIGADPRIVNQPEPGTPGTRTFIATTASGEPATVTVPIVLPLNEHARVWMLLSGVLGILLIALLVITGYLWNVNGKWQSQVVSLTTTGYDLGDRIADNQRKITQLTSSNSLLTDQLSAAKDKVLTLSNEKAQWSDDAAYAQQQVDLVNGQIDDAKSVISQITRCIEGEQQLLTYVRSVDTYTPEQISVFELSVNELCNSATRANNRFQDSLNP